MTGKTALDSQICHECGAKTRSGAAFCGQCGAKVLAPTAAPAGEEHGATEAGIGAASAALNSNDSLDPAPAASVIGESGSEAAQTETEYDGKVDDDSGEKNRAIWIFVLLVLAIVFGAGGAFLFLNPTVEDLSEQAADRTTANEDPVDTEPMVLGRYTGFYMDQDISITILGDDPQILFEANGIARYSNIVTGQECVSRLEPVSDEVVGGVVDTAVLFNQRPVPGETACSQSIPVKIDISEQQKGANFVVNVMSVEWLAPARDQVLMQGDLTRLAE